LTGKEFYKTTGFKEIAMTYGDTEQSYRKTAEFINRIRYQNQGGRPYRTIQENTEKEGSNVIDCLEEKTGRILEKHAFGEEGVYNGNNPEYARNEPVTLDGAKIREDEDTEKSGDNIWLTIPMKRK